METLREKAIAWFNSLSVDVKSELSNKHFHSTVHYNFIGLTGSEIESIWRREKKYVVLEHLTMPHRGKRFWSTNTLNNTHSVHGDLWYEEIFFTDDEEEAIKLASEINKETYPTGLELHEYYFKQVRDL